MFRIADPHDSYPHPVTVPVPVGGGRTERHAYEAHFRLLPASRIEELAREGDRALLAEALVGWEGIEAADGTPLIHTEASRSQLLDILHFARATAIAYIAFAGGEAQAGNFAGRLGTSWPPRRPNTGSCPSAGTPSGFSSR